MVPYLSVWVRVVLGFVILRGCDGILKRVTIVCVIGLGSLYVGPEIDFEGPVREREDSRLSATQRVNCHCYLWDHEGRRRGRGRGVRGGEMMMAWLWLRR